MTNDRDPDVDVLLYGVAYGILQDDGSTYWLDPATVVVRRAGVDNDD
jgi:hypothetical protein